MSLVKIPFRPYFKEPMLAGIKTCTARTTRKGEPGDTFEAFGGLFQILKVEQVPLHVVADFWHEEGCASREDFLDVWKEIHPVGYRPRQVVFHHWFVLRVTP